MKKILIALSLIGLSYQSQAQDTLTYKTFTFVYSGGLVVMPSSIDNDSARTVNSYLNSDRHKELLNKSEKVYLIYNPDQNTYQKDRVYILK